MYRIKVLFVVMMYSVCLFGQIELGGKIGCHHTNTAKGIGGKSYDSFVFGLTSSWKICSRLSINGDILFSKRGYVVEKGTYDAMSKVYKDCKVIFRYVDMPLLLEFNANNYLSLELGPYVGLQASRSLYFDNEKQKESLLGKKQPFDMGVLMGVKGKYKRTFIEVLYQKGFTQSFKDVKGFNSTGVCVNIGYMFNLK